MATIHLKHDREISDLGTSVMVPSDRGMVRVDLQDVAPRSSAQVMISAENKRTNGERQVRTTGVTNSSRWTDGETRVLLEVWGARYCSLKFKKRNFKDWEMISREFNKRCQINGVTGLGPRTGAQCKIRIKNIIADYKRTKKLYQGQNRRQLFPFFDTIDSILGKPNREGTCSRSDNEVGEEVKDEKVAHLDLQTEVMETSHVGIATATVAVPVPTVAVPVPTAALPVHTVSLPVHTTVALPIQTASIPVATVPEVTLQGQIPYMGPPSMALSSAPNFQAASSVSTYHTPLAPLNSSVMEGQFVEAYPEAQRNAAGYGTLAGRHVTPPYDNFKRKISDQAFRGLVQKKKLRKNPRPVKVVKVTGKVSEDDKLLSIVREFMEERRKREEELFDKLIQQQAEAEKRYQEFTLNVIKEIGRLFRPEAGT